MLSKTKMKIFLFLILAVLTTKLIYSESLEIESITNESKYHIKVIPLNYPPTDINKDVTDNFKEYLTDATISIKPKGTKTFTSKFFIPEPTIAEIKDFKYRWDKNYGWGLILILTSTDPNDTTRTPFLSTCYFLYNDSGSNRIFYFNPVAKLTINTYIAGNKDNHTINAEDMYGQFDHYGNNFNHSGDKKHVKAKITILGETTGKEGSLKIEAPDKNGDLKEHLLILKEKKPLRLLSAGKKGRAMAKMAVPAPIFWTIKNNTDFSIELYYYNVNGNNAFESTTNQLDFAKREEKPLKNFQFPNNYEGGVLLRLFSKDKTVLENTFIIYQVDDKYIIIKPPITARSNKSLDILTIKQPINLKRNLTINEDNISIE